MMGPCGGPDSICWYFESWPSIHTPLVMLDKYDWNQMSTLACMPGSFSSQYMKTSVLKALLKLSSTRNTHWCCAKLAITSSLTFIRAVSVVCAFLSRLTKVAHSFGTHLHSYKPVTGLLLIWTSSQLLCLKQEKKEEEEKKNSFNIKYLGKIIYKCFHISHVYFLKSTWLKHVTIKRSWSCFENSPLQVFWLPLQNLWASELNFQSIYAKHE